METGEKPDATAILDTEAKALRDLFAQLVGALEKAGRTEGTAVGKANGDAAQRILARATELLESLANKACKG